MHKLIIAGVGVLAVSLFAIGCGGGGNDEATAQVSRGEFYNQARTVCAGAQKELQKLAVTVKEAGESPSHFYSKVGPLLKGEAEELESIAGPRQTEEKVEPLIENILKASRLVAKLGEAAVGTPSVETYKNEARALHLVDC